MIPWAGACFLGFGFVLLANRLDLPGRSRRVLAVSRESFRVIRSRELGDAEKERALQSNAGRLFGLFVQLALGGAAAVLLPLAVVWLADQFHWLSLAAVLSVALSPAFLTASAAVALLALWLGSGPSDEGRSYGAMDRALHRIAFLTYDAQAAIADIETAMARPRLAALRTSRPVFITGLPRAGTTLLLEWCGSLPEFASHCYRDMPFVLIPWLWNRFSAPYRKRGAARERQHGDGMLIDFDSPEALEEIIWKTFWKQQYRRDRILTWGDAANPEFEEFFRTHMRKIVLLRRGAAQSVRYISKNNASIARTHLLRRLFPDAVILVPFREPFQHAASLLKQHLNFSRLHERDRFASDYMRALGHFDFGKHLRPIDFGGWFDARRAREPDQPAFWLEYWVAAYAYLLAAEASRLRFVNYEELCADAPRGLARLAKALDLAQPDALISRASGIRPARPHPVDVASVPDDVRQSAERLYARLQAAA